MFKNTGNLFFPLLPFVAAQYSLPPPGLSSPTALAASSVPSAPPSTLTQINIDVAYQGQFTFNPSNFNASIGTQVAFYFPASPVPHSVTQSSFESPCTYLTASGGTSAGFDSAIWFHCKQVAHCGLGMVGSINAPAIGNTYATFLSTAKTFGPDAPTEIDHGAVTGGLHGVATAAPSSDVEIAILHGKPHTSRLGPIIGGALGGLALILLSVLLWAFLRSRRTRNTRRNADPRIQVRTTNHREAGESASIQDGPAEPNSADAPMRVVQPSRFRIHEDSGEDFVQPDGAEIIDMPPIYDSVIARQMPHILPPHQSLPGSVRAPAADKRPIVLTYNAHNGG